MESRPGLDPGGAVPSGAQERLGWGHHRNPGSEQGGVTITPRTLCQWEGQVPAGPEPEQLCPLVSLAGSP